MKIVTFAALTALLSAAPAAAQDLIDALDAATATPKLDVSTPLDATLTCDQLKAEIALHDQEIIATTMRMNAVVASQLDQQMGEHEAKLASNKMAIALNAIAPGLGTAVDAAADAALKAKQKTREAKLVADAGSIAGSLNFASQRMTYLYGLQAQRCGASAAAR